jgi:aspartate 1-decarboxylase
MPRCLVRSNTQRLVVTEENLKPESNLEPGVGPTGLADILSGKLSQVVSTDDGSWFETCVVVALAGSDTGVLNRASARISEVGRELTASNLGQLDESGRVRMQ